MSGFYAYIPTAEGSKPVGSFDQRILRDLKTLKGALNRLKQYTDWKHWEKKAFIIEHFTSFHNDSTFTKVYTHKPITNETANKN